MKILFVDATADFSPDRIENKPTGGILNSLTKIPQYLAKKGHVVYVNCDCKKIIKVNDVTYLPLNHKKKIPAWDITVLNRNAINNGTVSYSKSIKAKIVWWLHDIVDTRYLVDGAYKYVDKIIALSEYCKKSYSEFYDIDLEKFAIIPNGVDKSIFYPGDYKKRSKYKLILASAPIKGYLPVDQTWMDVNRQFAGADLYIYSNQNLHGQKNNAHTDNFLDGMESLGAHVQQPVKQAVLAEIMRNAWILLMPNSYPEICSNLLLQARACGLPVVASQIGANPEFIENGKTGIITEDYPHDIYLWVKKYSEAVVKLCANDKLHQEISEQTPKGIPDWEAIGELWNQELENLCSKD